jgi:hypothetical protein
MACLTTAKGIKVVLMAKAIKAFSHKERFFCLLQFAPSALTWVSQGPGPGPGSTGTDSQTLGLPISSERIRSVSWLAQVPARKSWNMGLQ